MLGDLVRYAAARLRYRGEQNRRFLAGGLGIEERSRRLGRYWALHHNASRLEQIEWTRTIPAGSSLTIIGAGRLQDAAWPELAAHFGAITLTDADPLAAGHWRRAARGRDDVRFDIRDVTGVAGLWRDRVARDLPRRDWEAALAWVRQAHLGEASPPRIETDAAISLNLLGQIPLWWQDAVEEALQKRFGRKRVHAGLDDWLAALEPSAGWIVEEHLRSLSQSRHALLITDVEYVHYRGCPSYSLSAYTDPPAQWIDGKWISGTTGFSCEVEPALYTFRPDLDSEWTRVLPSHQLTARDHWLWHLSPLGTEPGPDGLLHRVGAYRLERARDRSVRE